MKTARGGGYPGRSFLMIARRERGTRLRDRNHGETQNPTEKPSVQYHLPLPSSWLFSSHFFGRSRWMVVGGSSHVHSPPAMSPSAPVRNHLIADALIILVASSRLLLRRQFVGRVSPASRRSFQARDVDRPRCVHSVSTAVAGDGRDSGVLEVEAAAGTVSVEPMRELEQRAHSVSRTESRERAGVSP